MDPGAGPHPHGLRGLCARLPARLPLHVQRLGEPGSLRASVLLRYPAAVFIARLCGRLPALSADTTGWTAAGVPGAHRHLHAGHGLDHPGPERGRPRSQHRSGVLHHHRRRAAALPADGGHRNGAHSPRTSLGCRDGGARPLGDPRRDDQLGSAGDRSGRGVYRPVGPGEADLGRGVPRVGDRCEVLSGAVPRATAPAVPAVGANAGIRSPARGNDHHLAGPQCSIRYREHRGLVVFLYLLLRARRGLRLALVRGEPLGRAEHPGRLTQRHRAGITTGAVRGDWAAHPLRSPTAATSPDALPCRCRFLDHQQGLFTAVRSLVDPARRPCPTEVAGLPDLAGRRGGLLRGGVVVPRRIRRRGCEGHDT